VNMLPLGEGCTLTGVSKVVDKVLVISDGVAAKRLEVPLIKDLWIPGAPI
jgi:hypothetical protein